MILMTFSSCKMVNKKLNLLKKNEIVSYFSKIKERKEIEKLVEDWQGREIIFPDDMVFTVMGKDTVDSDFRNNDYKIFLYVDSASCLSCNLQLSKWTELIEEADSVANGNISFLFAFNSKTIKELYQITKKDDFSYPVFADFKDNINKINNFSSNEKFHAFLLDKHNRVCAIGNPVHNPHVKELYIKIIMGEQEAQKEELTTIESSISEIDFGEINLGEIIEKEIEIQNIGKYDFVLKDIVSSCDCTEGVAQWKILKSGDKKNLTIRFKADEKGEFVRTVSIYGNTKDGFSEIFIQGIVK